MKRRRKRTGRRAKPLLRIPGGNGVDGDGDGKGQGRSVDRDEDELGSFGDDESMEVVTIGGSSQVSFHTDGFEDRDKDLHLKTSVFDEDDGEDDSDGAEDLKLDQARRSFLKLRLPLASRHQALTFVVDDIDEDSEDEEEGGHLGMEGARHLQEQAESEEEEVEEEVVRPRSARLVTEADPLKGEAKVEEAEASQAKSKETAPTQEASQAKLEESNMAGYGGTVMREIRLAAAETDLNLVGAGQRKGIEIWRVENNREMFGVKRWPRQRVGEFYEGDCYIVLNTYARRGSNKLVYDVHFWLGKDSTQDERGVAAYKTVELDDLLRDQAIQHREIQGYESSLFRSYFAKTGMKFLRGGVDSGFNHVKAKDFSKYKKLFVVKREFSMRRSKTPLTFEVPPLACNLNQGDVFVLDRGDRVYIWIGSEASPSERFAGCLMVNKILGARHGKARRYEIDDIFWQTLQGGESDVRASSDDGYLVDVKKSESLDKNSLELFRISDASGKMDFTLEKKGQLALSDLDENDVFLVNSNVGVWVWQGSAATKQEKGASFGIANKFVEDRSLGNVPISFVREDQAYRSLLFRNLFAR